MAHDTEQSDGDIVAMKAANKGARAPAESLEQRTPTERIRNARARSGPRVGER